MAANHTDTPDPQLAPPQRLHALVYGHVQGVCFRSSAEDAALSLGLAGYVRNRADRTVEVVAEGPRARLEELLAWLHEGPPRARVSRVDATWQIATGAFHSFEVCW
ncbi:MAG: acylphosphatase [Chloroflexi bacterium]|nr:acylphosphatase [Chloroflexota bacterium]